MTVDGEACAKKSENGGPVTYNLEGIHILIAEDNEITQNLMKRIFQRHGISVDLAENGQKALEMLQQNRYDLLLMDIQMPILNGIDTTKLIRREERFKDLPIIALSAFIDQEVEAAALESGMNGFVTKPLTEQAIHDLITTYLLPLKEKS